MAARTYAGPAVVLSYALSGFVALLASLCYAEYAADMPVAGGAYNFISMTFGEYAAWWVGIHACCLGFTPQTHDSWSITVVWIQ